jgi:hypothetical protein
VSDYVARILKSPLSTIRDDWRLSSMTPKGAGRFGIPALSMFLLIGMAVGREGPGGVPFSSYLVAADCRATGSVVHETHPDVL